MEGNKEAQKEARINTGLRNYWYPVAASWNVKNAPVGITRLSQNIVLWRDTAGQVHALEDRWEALPPYFITSSEKKMGRDEVLDYIDEINKSLAGE